MIDYSASKEIIHSTKLLNDSDAAFIDENIGKIQANWEKRQIYRTETEMRVSVLNDGKHPTEASKYWQCIREQSAMYEQLVQLSFDYRRKRVAYRQLQKAIETAEGDELELLQIDKEEMEFTFLHLEQQAKDRLRELRLWDRLMDECVERDPNFDTENVNTHQLISYAKTFRNRLASVGPNSTQGERFNAVSQAKTAERHLKEAELNVLGNDGPQLSISYSLGDQDAVQRER
jgi:hypothetical protein